MKVQSIFARKVTSNHPLFGKSTCVTCVYYVFLCRRRLNAALALPSIFRQSQQCASSNKNMCPKVVQTWDRDIVCLPECLCIHGSTKYPRGKYRARSGNLGLIGKIHLTSDVTVDEVASEVRSVFKKPMAGRSDFPFEYLQPTGTGSRCLTIPAVASSFAWTAKQVARLSTSGTGTIYILAKANLEVDDGEEVITCMFCTIICINNSMIISSNLCTLYRVMMNLMMREVKVMKGNFVVWKVCAWIIQVSN